MPRPGEMADEARVLILTPGLGTLADELAELLTLVPAGLPLRALARRVRRRDSYVRLALRTDPRFGVRGTTRGRRWYVRDAHRGPQNDVGRNLSGDPGPDTALTESGPQNVAEPVVGETA
jgi:hypothetical protein